MKAFYSFTELHTFWLMKITYSALYPGNIRVTSIPTQTFLIIKCLTYNIYIKHKLIIMKTQTSRAIALLLLAALGFTSCSAEYRERRRHGHDDRGHSQERVNYRN
ncbi:MAG: hypothetical protein JWR38_3699 [Mucilaginibacter sp.]|nr:hypothetical protein [Mucilaginibacter sp.]